MGASNAIAAYMLWGDKVPNVGFKLLIYMCLISKDADEEPWFSQGYEALAEHALRRKPPLEEADIKAVERGMKSLHSAGAITTKRKASPRRDGKVTAKYVLNVRPGLVPRKTGGDVDQQRACKDPARPPKNVQVDPRKTSDDPPFFVQSPPEKRGAEETGGTRRSEKTKEEEDLVRTDLTVTRARGPNEDQIFSAMISGTAPPATPKRAAFPPGHGVCIICADEGHLIEATTPDGSFCHRHIPTGVLR